MCEELLVLVFFLVLNYFYLLVLVDFLVNLVQVQCDYFGVYIFEWKDEL